MSALSERVRLVIEGDSRGASRALHDFSQKLKSTTDGPLKAFHRGLSLGNQHSITFSQRLGLVKSGLSKLKSEGFAGLNGAMQNFGTAVSGTVLKIAAWGGAIVAAASAGAAAIERLIAKYVEVGKQVAAVGRITGSGVEGSNRLRVQFRMLGMDVETSAQSLGMFTTKLGEAQRTGRGAAADALARLGVSLRDQNGALRDNADVLAEVRDRLSQLREQNLAAYRETSRALFGRGYMTLDKWLGASAERMKAFNEIAGSLSTQWDPEGLSRYLQDSREIALRWEDLQTTLGSILIELKGPLITTMNSISAKLSEISRALNRIPGRLGVLEGAILLVLNPAEALRKAFELALRAVNWIIARIVQLSRLPVFNLLTRFLPGYFNPDRQGRGGLLQTMSGLPIAASHGSSATAVEAMTAAAQTVGDSLTTTAQTVASSSAEVGSALDVNTVAIDGLSSAVVDNTRSVVASLKSMQDLTQMLGTASLAEINQLMAGGGVAGIAADLAGAEARANAARMLRELYKHGIDWDRVPDTPRGNPEAVGYRPGPGIPSWAERVKKMRLPGLADEGLVRARPGGTIVRLAEGGEDEIVLKASRLRKPAVVNHFTINIASVQGTDERAARQLCEMVERRLSRRLRFAHA